MVQQPWQGLVHINPTIEIFISHHENDKSLFEGIEKQLGSLKRSHSFEVWHRGMVLPGAVVKQSNYEHLHKAQIILLLMSADSMNSDDCYLHQMLPAIERHERGEAWVIPVILRPVHWQGTPFARLQPLPTGAEPVTSPEWRDLDAAFHDVAEGVRQIVETLATRIQWLNKGMTEYEAQQYNEALDTLDQAILLNPNHADTYLRKGRMLLNLERYQEAFDVYNQAIEKIPNNTWIWHGKGLALFQLGNNTDAISAFYQSLGILNSVIGNWHRKGCTLSDGLHTAEILAVLDQAIHIDSSCADLYLLKGKMLLDLERYQEAFDVYDQATGIIPNNTWIWHDKGLALFQLGHDEDAILAFNLAIQIDPGNMWAWHHKAIAFDHLARQAHEKAQQLGYKE